MHINRHLADPDFAELSKLADELPADRGIDFRPLRQAVFARAAVEIFNRAVFIIALLVCGYFAGYAAGIDIGRDAPHLEKQMQDFYRLDAERQLRELQIIKNQIKEGATK